jgi:hypothetical protein
MSIEVISFLIGGILIATSIVGGGFEIKEIKMPRVGAGARVVSLVVGSGFLVLGLSMWSMSNPQLLADQAPAAALMAGARTGSPSAPRAESRAREAEPREVRAEAAVPVPEQAEWAQPEAPSVFTGFNGGAQITWTAEGVTYYGAANFNGTRGILRVSYFHPLTETQMQVDQDLVLREQEGVPWYLGENPRESASQAALDESRYLPDNFRVVVGSQGWTMDQTCSNGTCYPVSVQAR